MALCLDLEVHLSAAAGTSVGPLLLGGDTHTRKVSSEKPPDV